MSSSVNIVLTDEQQGGIAEWGTNETGIEFLTLAFPTSAMERSAGGGLTVYLSGSLPTGTGTE